MIKKISNNKITYILLFFLFLYLSAFSSKANTTESKIILKINDSIITNIDIKNEANYLKALNPNLVNLENKKISQIAKNSLIREKIKEIEISKLDNQKISAEYLDSVIKSIYTNIGINSREEFLRYINNLNIKILDIESKLLIEALWNRLIYKKFYSKIKINENKIRQELKTNKQTSNSYFLYEILFNAEENEKIIQLHNNIKKSIEENGFENTASIFSISDSSKSGGRLGWINESALNKKILSQILNLKKGEYTKPITVPGGFLILKIQDIKIIEKEINLEKELSNKIRAMKNEQLNQYSNIYFNKVKKEISIDEK